jgi:glycosyltransferase involved in cell wall biosynthesis
MKIPDYIWIVIPVYNHSATIKNVVDKTEKYTSNIVVVDDGSDDADIKQILKESDIHIITHEKNRGKGAALRTAANFIQQKDNSAYIITLDADGQHNPEDIDKFIPYITENRDIIILGNRDFSSGNVPEKSKFGRKFSNFWIQLETGCKVYDSQSGFRGYPLKLLTDTKCISEHYAFETEILVRGVWSGLKVVNVNISVYYPEKKKRISHFRPLIDNLRISLLHSRLTAERFFRIILRK